MKSYLCNRKQYTVIDNIKSNYSTVLTGVPQGSTLGPLLFLLYINDIINSSQIINFTLFADDTNLTHSESDLETLTRTLNIELSNVSTWLSCNKLSLNVDKSNYLIFAGKKRVENYEIRICNNSIQQRNSLKYLGINIDDQLNWNIHINHVNSKLAKSLGILHKIKHLLTTDTLLLLYYALFYPYIQYCNVVWGMATITSIKPLVIMQKRIIRTIGHISNYQHTNPIFKSSKILKITDVYKLECLKFIHEQLHRHNLVQLTTASDVHNINTRNRHNLRPPFPDLEAQKRFVLYYGCREYNELPDYIKNIINKDTFKINTKKHLINLY